MSFSRPSKSLAGIFRRISSTNTSYYCSGGRPRILSSRPVPVSESSAARQGRFFRPSSSARTAGAGGQQQQTHHHPDPKRRSRWNPTAAALLASGATLAAVLLGFLATAKPLSADALGAADGQDVRYDRDVELPRFRIAEIKRHDARSGNPWVTRGDKVYDITDWVGAHPGGDVILRAAGGSVDPYWDIFTIHKQSHVEEILEQYLIGHVHDADLVDGQLPQNEIEDPFVDDPPRHADLITRTAKPRNAETPPNALTSQFLTPNELFYVRNHMWVPTVDGSGADHALTIEFPDGSTKSYTLRELKERFKPHKITATLQCSGNRRKHMSTSASPTNGIQWNVGAISCAEWEGVRLVDVLKDAGLPIDKARDGETEAKHVWFAGLEAYGASIPLETAVDPRADVLLAYGMNGKTLPRDHGFPLRAMVPGHVAARSVKWLNHIVLSDEESPSQWQRRDYKCFGPNETRPNWDEAPAIQEMPITSAITSVRVKGEAQPKATAALEGYAYSGGGREIVRVDVSLDGGKSWDQAELMDVSRKGEDHKHWAWKRWRYEGTLPPGEEKGGQRCSTAVVKATDDAYNSQPECHKGIYNLRGNLATAWHRMEVCTKCSEKPRGTSSR